MCSIESVELRLAEEKIEALESEIDDYREFVKSAEKYLTPTAEEQSMFASRADLHNLRTMCNYLKNRYINLTGVKYDIL